MIMTLNMLVGCDIIIGASLSEPHINGSAVRELYIYYYYCYYGTSVTRNIYAQLGSMDISAKYSIAHSRALAHGLYVRCSNLANCRFTLVHSARTA